MVIDTDPSGACVTYFNLFGAAVDCANIDTATILNTKVKTTFFMILNFNCY